MRSNFNNLPLDIENPEVVIMAESALSWIAENTSIVFDPEAELPSNVKLFVIKYCELMSVRTGVASESVGGMSQSFSTTGGTGSLLADLAKQLFGSAYKSRNKFVSAVNRWK